MEKKLRVGLIGLGEAAQLIHLPTLWKLDRYYQVVALTDASPGLGVELAGKYGGKVYPSAEELVQAEDVDCVFVLSPDAYHFEHAVATLEQGKHLFLEKPACFTAGEVDRLRVLARHSDRVVMVGYMRRFAPAYLAAKEELFPSCDVSHVQVQDIICPNEVFVRQGWPMLVPKDVPQRLLAQGRDRMHAALDEACGFGSAENLRHAYRMLIGLSSHSLSALRELVGMPQAVKGVDIKQGGDSVTVLFDYGHFTAVYTALIDSVPRFDSFIRVYAGQKTIQIKYQTPYIRSQAMELVVQHAEGNLARTITSGPFFEDPFDAELKYFHQKVLKGEAVKTDLDDSAEDFKIFDMILKYCHQTVVVVGS